MTRPFLVTGTGRCGTGWMARALTQLGLRCSHEGIFNPQALADGSWRDKYARQRAGSSWLAISVIDEIPRDVAVIQVVREPLAVIRSLMGIQFFSAGGEYTEIARKSVSLPDDELEACAWFWIEANRLIARRANAIVRIEDPWALRTVTATIAPDREFRDEWIEGIVCNLPPYNHRERDESITLGDLRPYTRNALVEAARRFGYEA